MSAAKAAAAGRGLGGQRHEPFARQALDALRDGRDAALEVEVGPREAHAFRTAAPGHGEESEEHPVLGLVGSPEDAGDGFRLGKADLILPGRWAVHLVAHVLVHQAPPAGVHERLVKRGVDPLRRRRTLPRVNDGREHPIDVGGPELADADTGESWLEVGFYRPPVELLRPRLIPAGHDR